MPTNMASCVQHISEDLEALEPSCMLVGMSSVSSVTISSGNSLRFLKS